MSEDKIEVNMNIYDIPIVVEQLEKANKEIERLNNIIDELEKCIDERIIRTKKEPIREKERNRILYNLAYILDKLQELKGDDKE